MTRLSNNHAPILQHSAVPGDAIEDFISFASEPAQPAEASEPDAADAGDALPTFSGRVETPWKAGSHRISSPLIRLHNGERNVSCDFPQLQMCNKA